MRICVSNWSLQEEICAGRMDAAGFLDFCRENGVTDVELLGEYARCPLRDLGRMLRERGLRVAAWSALNNFLVPEGPQLDAEIEGMKRSIEQACFLGARVLRVFSGDSDAMPRELGMRQIVRAFAACAPYALEKGVVMALENHGVFAGRSSQVLEILDAVDSPALQTTLDPSNYLFVEEDPLRAARAVRGRVAHVHVKDYRKSVPGDEPYCWATTSGAMYSCVPLGEGGVDWPGILGVLEASGYGGCLSVEYEGARPLEGTVSSLRALRALGRG